MQPEPTGDDIKAAYDAVAGRIRDAAEGCCVGRLKATTGPPAAEAPRRLPLVIAISKTKSAACMLAAYHVAGIRVFGENYVQECVDKAPLLPADCRIHFVGHLQSNKVRELIRGCPQLSCIHSIDSVKLATLVNKEVGEVTETQRSRPIGEVLSGAATPSSVPTSSASQRLPVYVQLNTSFETTKSGLNPNDPAALVAICRHIVERCPHLLFSGLMTIGNPDGETAVQDFDCLFHARDTVAAALGVPATSLELSMGMSGDFETAIRHGATVVRIGSAIFGSRAPRRHPPHVSSDAAPAALRSAASPATTAAAATQEAPARPSS